MAQGVIRYRRLWIGLAVSGLFLYLVGKHVDVSKVQDALRSADYRYLPLAVLLTFVTNLFRAYRWKWVLKPIQRIGVLSLFSGVAIGYMTNNLLPARLGEIVRAHIMGTKEGISRSTTLATILVERIFDGLTLLFFLGLMSLSFPFPGWIHQAGIVSGLIFVSALGGLYFVMAQNNFRSWVEGVLRVWVPGVVADRIKKLTQSFLAGLVVLRRQQDIVRVFFASVAIWLVEALTYDMIVLAFGIQLPFYVSVLSVVIVNLGIMIPAGPGSIGTFEFFAMYVLALFAIESHVALSIAIVLHAILFIPITVVGMFCFWKENFGLSELRLEILSKGN